MKKKRTKKSRRRSIAVPVIVAVICILTAAVLLRNVIVKAAVERIGSHILGAQVGIERFSIGLVRQSVRIQGLKVHQPHGFGDGMFLSVPEIEIHADFRSLLSGRIYIRRANIFVNESVIIRDKSGSLNTDALKVVKNASSNPTPATSTKFHIKELKLSINRVVYEDFSRGSNPVVKVYDVGIKGKVFRDIDGVGKLATLIVVQTMGPTAIKGAGIYAAATLMGVSFLPAGIIGAIVAKDDSSLLIRKEFDEVYRICLDFIRQQGRLKKQHKGRGIITAKINAYDVKFEIIRRERQSTQVRVSARKLLIPQPSIAGGLAYQLKKFITEDD